VPLPSLTARRIFKDKLAKVVMLSVTSAALLILVAMGVGLYGKSAPVFTENTLGGLLGGSVWRPHGGQFGFLSFIMSSVYVTLMAIAVALPLSLLSAVYLTESAPKWLKRFFFPILDILAGIPAVVYGVWGELLIVPFVSETLGPRFTGYTSGYCLFSCGLVLGFIIIPLLMSLLIEIFSAVPNDYKEASDALGATRWQTTRMIVIRKSMPGIIAAVVLAISKAFGETIAVMMLCGNIVHMPESPFDSCYPLPALIANNYGEMVSMSMYESALMFAAFLMFIIVLIFNIIARLLLQRVEKRLKL
jgi:phosphate transport system permease protein